MSTTEIVCVVKEIRVGLGMGNYLFLFRGDRVNISTSASEPKGRYKVLDNRGMTIGTITRRDIRNITQQESAHALATKE